MIFCLLFLIEFFVLGIPAVLFIPNGLARISPIGDFYYMVFAFTLVTMIIYESFTTPMIRYRPLALKRYYNRRFTERVFVPAILYCLWLIIGPEILNINWPAQLTLRYVIELLGF